MQLAIENIPLGKIRESSFNPRRTFTDMDELAEDIGKRGVLQPILVRSVDGVEEYEVVFGARRFRGASMALLKTIPAMVREMDDQEALEVMLVENAKRADVHPLEEAEAYRSLHEKHGLSAEDIGAKVGKSKSYVYGRLKLCDLPESGSKAVYDGKMTVGAALRIARIPDATLRKAAVKDVLACAWEGGAVGASEAGDVISSDYTQILKGAPFKIDDATLVPSAGACSKCALYTRNTPELFEANEQKGHVCTDTKCFKEKADAAWKIRQASAKAKGITVITKKKDLKEGCGCIPFRAWHTAAGTSRSMILVTKTRNAAPTRSYWARPPQA